MGPRCLARADARLQTKGTGRSFLSPRHIFQIRKRASGSNTCTTNREPPSIFGAMQGQATGQMSRSDSGRLFLRLSKQKAQVESAQTQESFVAAVGTVKAMAMAVLHTR